MNEVNATANHIRSSNPRPVTIVANDVTPQDEIRIAELRKQIQDAEKKKEQFVNLFPNEYRAIEDIQREIDGYRYQLSQSSKGTTTVTTINGMDITLDAPSQGIQGNILNDYLDVQYHIVFNMLSQKAALDFQKTGYRNPDVIYDINTMKSTSRKDNAITFASTAGIFNDADKHYYNIESLVYKNFCEPTMTNPLIASMLNMKMKLTEPHGWKLYEDLRDLGSEIGYDDINLGRFLFRVDIYFSGYSEDGTWHEQIILNDAGVAVISSVVSITNLEATITSAGTVYELDLVPAGHHAHRTEDIIFEANTFNSGMNFREFLTNFGEALSKSKESKTDGKIIRHYEFYAPQELLDSPFDVQAFVKDNQKLISPTDPQHTTTSGNGVDILTVLKGVLGNTLIAREMALSDHDNSQFSKPVVLFQVEFNTIYGNPSGGVTKDPGLHDYKEITHQYIIVPFITFKHGPVTQDNIYDYVAPENQQHRINEIVRMGMVRRVYDYLYTGENTEVIDFDIKLKTFFYNTLNVRPQTGGSPGRQDFSQSASTARTYLDSSGNATDLFRINIAGGGGEKATMERIFGINNGSNRGGGSNRVGPARLGGGFGENPDTEFYGDTSTPPDSRRTDYENFMVDYLSQDLLSLNGMRVKGDPIWLLSPYSNADLSSYENLGNTVGKNSLGLGGTIPIHTRTGQVIFLKIKPPQQNDYMNPNRIDGSSYPNIIGGFYQVLDITSTFEGGIFQQSINGVKINNLNYADASFLGSPS